MTKYTITKSDNSYKIEIKGHSEYADYGSDIVCASISTAVCLTANTIDKLGFSCNLIKNIHKEALYIIETDMKEISVIKVMESLEDYLDTISSQYPKYIKKS